VPAVVNIPQEVSVLISSWFAAQVMKLCLCFLLLTLLVAVNARGKLAYLLSGKVA